MTDPIKPFKPESCWLCAWVEYMTKRRGDFIFEGENVFVVPYDMSIGREFSLVISKYHFEGLTATEDQIIVEAMFYSRKYARFFKEHNPTVKGFRYSFLEGGMPVGQPNDHFRVTVVPVF